MKGLMTIMAAILLAGCIQEPQADVEGLEAMGDAWQSALESGDANAVAALYTEDGVVLPPNDETVAGRPEITVFWKRFLGGGLTGLIEDSEAYAQGDSATKPTSTALSSTELLSHKCDVKILTTQYGSYI